MVADRRLSVGGRPVRDDARKMMFLETEDGVAILGYAGLGSTASGTEPVDWMNAVLRGRKLPLEKALGVLAGAAKRQLPTHLSRIAGKPGPQHHIVIPAFVGGEIRLYMIGLAFAADRKSFQYQWTRVLPTGRTKPPPLAIAGSGAFYLVRQQAWRRPLLRLLAAHDRGAVSARAVADHLAAICYTVHKHPENLGVGPRSIVAWRHRKPGRYTGGGGHQFYTCEERDSSTPALPTIATGIDVGAIVKAMAPVMQGMMEAMKNKQPMPEFPSAVVNAELARMPHGPDERLK
jgi:hypothetical protein